MKEKNLPGTSDDVPAELQESDLAEGRGILVIEDEEMLRIFLRTILRETGYRVLLAADGAEGVRSFMERVNEISLVLLDMGLRGLSGEEVLARILWLRAGAKIIALSGSIEPEVQARAIGLGGVDYLPKPNNTKSEMLWNHTREIRGGPGWTTWTYPGRSASNLVASGRTRSEGNCRSPKYYNSRCGFAFFKHL